MILLLISLFISAKEPVRIAVIDSGFELEHINKIPLCDKSWNKSYIDKTINDTIGHGTNIVGLIHKEAINQDHCFIILKAVPGNYLHTKKAFDDAIKYKANIINYSAGGYEKTYSTDERKTIYEALKQGITIVNAAGNNNRYIGNNNSCIWFPGCYSNKIIMIGNIGSNTNYGPRIDYIINGNNLTAFNITSSGTSQSAAVFTGMYVNNCFKTKATWKFCKKAGKNEPKRN